MKSHMKKWGIVYILLALFLVSWLFHFWGLWTELALQKGPFPWNQFWAQFASSTFENWQSEFLQLLVQAWLVNSILSKWWFNADHSADKDDVIRIEEKLNRLLEKE